MKKTLPKIFNKVHIPLQSLKPWGSTPVSSLDINLTIFDLKYFIESEPKHVLNAKCFTVLLNQTKARAVTLENLLRSQY